MVKIGILGVGHLGKIHLKLLKEIQEFEVVGLFDPNHELAKTVASEFGVTHFETIESILEQADAVDIVSATTAHYDCAVQALKKGKHIFIEKPLTSTLHQAEKLLTLLEEADVKCQVGHIERFNPAFLTVRNYIQNPLFIEGHRLAQFNPRGTDVSVVLDLMIHDIDVVLSMVQSAVKKVSANGVSVITGSTDIANARIEFDNGCVANLTASRISVKEMRKMRIFQKDTYISVDFSEKKTDIFSLSDIPGVAPSMSMELGKEGGRLISFYKPAVAPVNAIKMELELFAGAIMNNTETAVTILDGYNALKLAHTILKKIESNNVFA